MNFWQNVENASGFPTGYRWVLGGFLLGAIAVFYLREAERTRIRSALILFAFSLIGLLIAGGLISYGLAHTHWIYLSVRGGALFMFASAVVTVASVFIFTILLRFMTLEPPDIAQDLILALVYIAVAIALLSASGLDLRGVVATSAVITAVIGFSLQDMLGNTIGGTLLQMEELIRVGDLIRVDQFEGRVKAIHWRQTSIETNLWDTVMIPNGVLAKSHVTVLGRRVGLVRHRLQMVYFRVALDHSPSRVIAVVEQALRADLMPCAAETPQLDCIITDMQDGHGIFALRYVLTDLDRTGEINSIARARIYAALQRANIKLAMPAQSVVLTEEKILRDRLHTEELRRRLAALEKIELFHSLTDEERQNLAAQLISAPFAHGESITRQDSVAHWLYVITEGEAEVQLVIGGQNRVVGTLRAGDYFGEMGLMTGEPRSATVVALTDVVCYRLSKETFEGVLRRRPEIVDEMSATLAYRRARLEAMREQVSEEALRDRAKRTRLALLKRIRQFFALSIPPGDKTPPG